MFELQSLLLFVVAGLALNLTPGPDLLYITARSLGQAQGAFEWQVLALGLIFILGLGLHLALGRGR